jgi:long-chain acyl-CoA synthetase
MNIALPLLAGARVWSDNFAVAGLHGTTLTYSDLARRSAAIASALTRRGSLPGDRVALVMSNMPEYFEVLLGIWAAGLCAVPMNPRLHAREFEYAWDNSGAKLCFASTDLISELDGTQCAIIEIGSDAYRTMLASEPIAPVERAPDDLAWLFYTSGTTGRPKGAMLSHRNIMAFVVSMLADGALHSNVLHMAPLSHGSGFLGIACLMHGKMNVVLAQRGLDRASMTAALRDCGPLCFFAVPTVLNKLVDELVPPEMIDRIQMIYFGGAPMYVDDLKRAGAFFGMDRLWHLYGQGEAPMTITYFPPWLRGKPEEKDYDSRLASVGIARSGVAIRVLDEDGLGCPPGQIGEVAVRGDVVMSGYWNDPDATKAAFRGSWLLTGDLGAMDAQGFLTLHDRSKDLIISGGSNIYPREIEEVLLTHPDVRECAVVGVRDRKWGEVPVAFIVTPDAKAPDTAALDAHCLAYLARFKRPRRYLGVAELPKNGYGKIIKPPLRERAEASQRFF